MSPDERAAELHSNQHLHPQENHHSSSSSSNNNGWPLGLHSFLDQIDSSYHHLRLHNPSYGHSHSSSHSHGALAPHMARSLSTPSITSHSCSSDDFETQSSGSFFPDQSTTLGSLIGLRSRPQTQAAGNHSKAMQHRAEKTRKQQQEGEKRMAMEASSAMLHRDRACCSLLVCRSGDRHKEMGMSPSLAHLLGKEKKAMGPSFLERKNKVRPWIKHRHGTLVVEQEGFALFDTGIIPSLPPPQRASGTPLKLFLQRSSPNSSYVSTHWDAFLRRSEADREEAAQDTRHSHGGIWSSLCFKDIAQRSSASS